MVARRAASILVMSDRRERPLGILVVVALMVVNGVVATLDFIQLGPEWPPWLSANFTGLREFPWFFLVVAAACLLAAVLLWSLDRRGWVLCMLIVGLGLVANLVLWWDGQPNHLRMGLNVAIAFYLNSAAVRGLFERRHEVPRVVLSERRQEP
jgi:hypothetical protein